jgi:hypothetical protein
LPCVSGISRNVLVETTEAAAPEATEAATATPALIKNAPPGLTKGRAENFRGITDIPIICAMMGAIETAPDLPQASLTDSAETEIDKGRAAVRG